MLRLLHIRNSDAALSQQVLDISKTEWKSKIQPDGMLDDLDWKTVTAIAKIVHRPWIPHDLNAKNYCDSTAGRDLQPLIGNSLAVPRENAARISRCQSIDHS